MAILGLGCLGASRLVQGDFEGCAVIGRQVSECPFMLPGPACFHLMTLLQAPRSASPQDPRGSRSSSCACLWEGLPEHHILWSAGKQGAFANPFTDPSSPACLLNEGSALSLLHFPCSFFKDDLICRLSWISHLSADDSQTQNSSSSQPLSPRLQCSNGYF